MGDDSLPGIEDWQADLLRDLSKMVADAGSLEAAMKALPAFFKARSKASQTAFAAWLAPALLLGALAGNADVQADAGDIGGQAPSPVNAVVNAVLWNPEPRIPNPSVAANAVAAGFDVQFQEAIAQLRAKTALSPDAFRALDAAAKAKAFSVAGLTDRYALETLREGLAQAVESGATVNDWLDRAEEFLTDRGLGTESPWHLRLVYRQNTFEAYSSGRREQMTRVAEARPFWQYITVGDENVRPDHALLDGVIRPAGDAFWDQYYPPWDYGCRCTVVSLDAEEMAADGLSVTENPPAPPLSPDFGGESPAVANAFDPSQARDEMGRWADEGGGGGKGPHTLRDREGAVIADVPEHVKALKIPPAWTDVQVSLNPKADLLAKGLDAKGRVQSIYSDSHNARQAERKYARVRKLGERSGEIESRLRADPSEESQALLLIKTTGIRPGSERDTGAKVQAYGATTLLGRHVISDAEGTRLVFTGKKGVALDIPVSDPAVAGMLRDRASRAGADGRLFSTDDSRLRDRMREVAGAYKPKDFRTLRASEIALQRVSEMPAPTDDRSYRRAVRSVAVDVSRALGNTPTVALQSYISPVVFAQWRRTG